MKKAISMLLACFMLVCTFSVMPVTAAATEITPFASDEIVSSAYTITSSKFAADINFNAKYSGSVYVELQKKSGTSWVYSDSTSGTFSSSVYAYVSKSASISSGTYRIKAVTTVNGNEYTRYSTEKSI